MGFEELERSTPDSTSDRPGSIDALRRQTAAIAEDVQAMAHELHSSKLQILGVVSAMKGLCSEISVRQNVEVDFSHQDVPDTVSPDIALCLFRVLQEALRNAVRHSFAKHVRVNILGTADALRLTVSDAGCGFAPESVSQHHGLGLTSMRERLKLVAGELVVESQPARGTTIVAQVPLPTTRKASPRTRGALGL